MVKGGPKRENQQRSVSNTRNNFQQSASTSVNGNIADESSSVAELCTYMSQTTISSNMITPPVVHNQSTSQLSYVSPTNEFVQDRDETHFVSVPQSSEHSMIPALQNNNLGNNYYGISQAGFFMHRFSVVSISAFIENDTERTHFASGGPHFSPPMSILNQQQSQSYNNESELPDSEQEMNNNVEPPPYYWRRNSGFPWNEYMHYYHNPLHPVSGYMYLYMFPPIIRFPNPFFGEFFFSGEMPIGYCNCSCCPRFQ